MKTNPEISVVITCFNYGHYLEGCLYSVLAQTYDNYEIIVVDDGSTDNTEQIMERFSALSNLRYIRQGNSGQASAKNKGIQNAQGRFVAFLDADDLWDETKLEKQIRLFENPKVGVVYSKSRPIDTEGRILKWNRPTKYLVARSGNVSNWLFFDNFVPFSSSIVKKECFEKIGVFNESLEMGIDWDLWLRISTSYNFDFINQELLFYRIGHSGQMSKNTIKRQECSDIIMNNFIRTYRGVLSNRIINKAYSYTYINRCNYYLSVDKTKSTDYLMKALQSDPFNIMVYKCFIKIIIK